MNITVAQTGNAATIKPVPQTQLALTPGVAVQSTAVQPDFASLLAAIPIKAPEVVANAETQQNTANQADKAQTIPKADPKSLDEGTTDNGHPLAQQTINPLSAKSRNLLETEIENNIRITTVPLPFTAVAEPLDTVEYPKPQAKEESLQMGKTDSNINATSKVPDQIHRIEHQVMDDSKKAEIPDSPRHSGAAASEHAVPQAIRNTPNVGPDIAAIASQPTRYINTPATLDVASARGKQEQRKSATVPSSQPATGYSPALALDAKAADTKQAEPSSSLAKPPAATPPAPSMILPDAQPRQKAPIPSFGTREAPLPKHPQDGDPIPSQTGSGSAMPVPPPPQTELTAIDKASVPGTSETPPAFMSGNSAARPEQADRAITAAYGLQTPTATISTIPTAHSDLPSLKTGKGAAGAEALLTQSGATDMISWEVSRAPSFHPAPTAHLRNDVAPNVARQLVEVMAQAAHRPVEIALAPAELGRVRMSVATEDGKITVSILAERPDTLELMRRHIDQLGQTFRNMGYEQISFSFGQGAQGGDQTRGGASNGTSGQTLSMTQSGDDAQPETDTIQPDRTGATGVDIRL